MDEAAKLNSSSGLRAMTYVTLIGLLSATGLRPGEALALDIGDVDRVTANFDGTAFRAFAFILARAHGALHNDIRSFCKHFSADRARETWRVASSVIERCFRRALHSKPANGKNSHLSG